MYVRNVSPRISYHPSVFEARCKHCTQYGILNQQRKPSPPSRPLRRRPIYSKHVGLSYERKLYRKIHLLAIRCCHVAVGVHVLQRINVERRAYAEFKRPVAVAHVFARLLSADRCTGDGAMKSHNTMTSFPESIPRGRMCLESAVFLQIADAAISSRRTCPPA